MSKKLWTEKEFDSAIDEMNREEQKITVGFFFDGFKVDIATPTATIHTITVSLDDVVNFCNSEGFEYPDGTLRNASFWREKFRNRLLETLATEWLKKHPTYVRGTY